MATWSRDTPRSAANFSIASSGVEVGLLQRRRSAWPAGCPAGAASPRRYLPVSRPRASGKYGSSDCPVWASAGTSSASMARLSQEYSFCAETNAGVAAGPGDPVGVDHLPAGQVGRAEVADLALLHQLVEGGQRLLDRGVRVGRVQLVEVDPVGAEPAQAGLHGDPDVAARAAGAPVRSVRPLHVAAELGGDDDLGAPATRAPGRAASPSRRRCRRRRRCRTG